jgi:hypothetical protein
MYISKKDRELIKMKFGGKCAYTGTDLMDDWQVDHMQAVRRNWFLKNSAMFEDNHNLNNMIPCQRIINHYKHSMNLNEFRDFMVYFHERIGKLPKNPKTEKSIKHKLYMLEVARLFDITPEKPFNGVFYFEMLKNVK